MIEDLRTQDGVEVHKVAVVCSSHLTPETSEALDEDPLEAGESRFHKYGLLFEAYDYGWRMHVRDPIDGDDPLRGSDEDGPVPADLRTFYTWAQENGIAWVAFDRDGDVYENLWPTWVW